MEIDAREIGGYRDKAQEFLTAYVQERNDFHAGLKEELQLEPIFAAHRELFREDSIGQLFAAHERALPARKRQNQYLLSFAVRTALKLHVHREDEEISGLLKGQVRKVDGEDLGFHECAVQLSQEPDGERRRRLFEARSSIQASTQTLRMARLDKVHEMARELSGMPYLECMQFLLGANFHVLRTQIEAFLAASGERYHRDLELHCARDLGGLRVQELGPQDVRFLFQGGRYDEFFPVDGLLSMLKRTLMGLGIDLKKQSGIRIDAEERRGKNTDAACFGIRVPGRIYLVLRPHGGIQDYLALLRQAGHALHLGHTSEDLPFEYRYLGDEAVGETYGALFQYLTQNPEWLQDFLTLDESREVVEFQRFRKLYWLRLYAMRFLYEMDLHEGVFSGAEAMQEAFLERHQKALGFPGNGASFLADVEQPFYGTAFLRAWIFEAELRQKMEERFGIRWYSRPAAGNFLKELWSHGTRYRVEGLARHIRMLDLDLEPIKRDLT
jgi:oligoendopeptidase F